MYRASQHARIDTALPAGLNANRIVAARVFRHLRDLRVLAAGLGVVEPWARAIPARRTPVAASS
ncbi:MAG: hypothetical protein ABW360_17580 [Phenylobacterium sp.]